MNWQERAGRGGVCDFKSNYDFYFKWLTDKVMCCFIIEDADQTEKIKTINWDYFKLNLILNGEICITDFNEKLYACIGSRGGAVNEYYLPTQFLIANPILGSKQVTINEDGVVIYNTKIDEFVWTGTGYIFSGGFYDLISQTASLLADNIITINCVQINTRVSTFFTSDSEAQAIAGEVVLKKMYAGKPYQILRSDLIEKINVNPVADAAGSQKITELIELHNYIIASFFQNIGIKANNTIKRERMITDEIDSQMDYLQINILEVLSSWQDGLDRVNELYGTKLTVRLNPILVKELLEEADAAAPAGDGESDQDEAAAPAGDGESDQDEAAAPAGDGESDQDEEAASAGDGESDQDEEAAPEPIEEIESKEEIIEDIVDLINDNEEPEEGENDEQQSTEEDTASDTD